MNFLEDKAYYYQNGASQGMPMDTEGKNSRCRGQGGYRPERGRICCVSAANTSAIAMTTGGCLPARAACPQYVLEHQ